MRKLFLASSFSEVASLFPKFAGEEIKGKALLLSQQPASWRKSAFM